MSYQPRNGDEDGEVDYEVSCRIIEMFPTPIDNANITPIVEGIVDGRLVIVDKSNAERVHVAIAPEGVIAFEEIG